MLQKTLTAVIGLVAFAAMTAIAVGAAAFSLYLVLAPGVGEAGAAAIVAGAFALVVAIGIVIIVSKTSHHKHEPDAHGGGMDFGLVERLIDMAKERPILSIGAALAAGVIAFRNPALVATIVAAFVDRPKKD